ncbi:MAG: acyltransferase family protein, partial [Candidatus Binatia bacterium]
MSSPHPASPAEQPPIGVATRTTFVPELDSLRAIAMLMVFAYHLDALILGAAGPAAGVSLATAFVRGGYSGVDLF